MTPLLKEKSYRPDIDGLRAIAVIAVIINHFDSKILTSGFLGVDIFFVISGFVVTSTVFHSIGVVTFSLLVVTLFASESLKFFSIISIVLLTFFLILLLKTESITRYILSNKFLVKVGIISYSLYLWHWVVIVISRYTVGIQLFTIPFQVIAILGFAILSYNLIEKPLRHAQWSDSKLKTIGYGISASMFSILWLFGLNKPLNSYAAKASLARFTTFSTQNEHSQFKWNMSSCSLDRENSYDSIEKLKIPKCILKNNENVGTIYLYGDSFAQQIVPALEIISKRHRMNLLAVASQGCPVDQEVLYSGESYQGFCSKASKKALSYIKEKSVKNDIVILSNTFSYFLKDGSLTREGKPLSKSQALESYYIFLKNLVKSLKEKGVRLYVVSNIPVINTSTPDFCIQSWSYLRKDCDASVNSLITDDISYINDALRQESQKNSYGFIDIFNFFRIILINETLGKARYKYYYNSSHISTEGVIQLVDVIDNQIVF